MKLRHIAPIAILSVLSACGSDEATENTIAQTQKNQTSDAKAKAPTFGEVSKIYLNIRELAAAGDLISASKFTDNPQNYVAKMELAISSMGLDTFQKSMQKAASPSTLSQEVASGDYTMLITTYSINGVQDKAANFFIKSGDSHVEILEDDDNVPCDLVRAFYKATNDTTTVVEDCTETAS